MSKKEKKQPAPEAQAPEEVQEPAAAPEEAPETQAGPTEVEALQQAIAEQEDKFLRLCAEYDNFRKRTQKEKEAIYADATANAVKALLPVYDNLERALKQETADEAYRKGVEMTMQQLKKVLGDLGLEEIPALGEIFDANVHSAVMHVEDPDLGENTVKEVYQAGFKMGDNVIRYAMVVVAN